MTGNIIKYDVQYCIDSLTFNSDYGSYTKDKMKSYL